MLQEARPAGLWSGAMVGATVPNRTWGSWVLVGCGALEPVAVSNYSGWVSGARWSRETAEPVEDVFLFSVHSPTSSEDEPRDSYVEESRKIVSVICKEVPSMAPLVIGGDFNFKSLGVRLSSEVIRTDASELEALQGFRDLGLSVAWQDAHPDQSLPQTLRWNRAPSTPYHCDGFLTRGLPRGRILCDVLSSEPEASQSDHNPVFLRVPPGGAV